LKKHKPLIDLAKKNPFGINIIIGLRLDQNEKN